MSGFLIALIAALHIAVCVGLMASILLQSGKGGGLAGTFGAGSSQTLFGGRGAATFLSRATTFLAVTFFVTSLTLGLNASRSTGMRRSLIQEEARRRSGQHETAIPGGGSAPAPAPAPTSGQPAPAGPMPGSVAPQATPVPASTATQPAKTTAKTTTKRPAVTHATPAPAPTTGTATESPSAPPTGTQAPSDSGK